MRLRPFGTPQIDATKKDEILDAALKVFAEVGFRESTVRQICKKAKANICLVSYYFDGKEALYKAVFERVYNYRISGADNLLQNVNEIQSIEEYKMRLKVYIEQLHEKMITNPDFFKLINREISEGMPRLEGIIKDFFGKTQQILTGYFIYGHKRKFLKKDIDPILAGAALMNIINGFAQRENLNRYDFFFPGIPQKEVPDRINKMIATIFFDGVLQ